MVGVAPFRPWKDPQITGGPFGPIEGQRTADDFTRCLCQIFIFIVLCGESLVLMQSIWMSRVRTHSQRNIFTAMNTETTVQTISPISCGPREPRVAPSIAMLRNPSARYVSGK